MTELANLTKQIKALAEANDRIIVAIAGSPGSGKSTLVSKLEKKLSHAVVVPMDGFHLDNLVLEKHGLMPRKGSPQTFDADGYYQLMTRLRNSKDTLYAPVFDRDADLSRAAAIEISSEVNVILTEGNYLLLQQNPWGKLSELFDLSVYLDIAPEVLRERLVNRWLEHGFTHDESVKRAESNDLPNAKLVSENSKQADFFINDF